MVGPTAQLIALACHFNGRSRGFPPSPFFPSNTTCKFCEYVHFSRFQKRWFGLPPKWSIIARTPDQWFAQECKPDRRAILTCRRSADPRLSDRLSAGFVGGGGTWQLNVLSNGQMDVWHPTWEVGDREAPGQRIWRVEYREIACNADLAQPVLQSPAALNQALKVTLAELIAFCERHQLPNYQERFATAHECLATDDPLALADHNDLGPIELFSLPARQLLAASQTAWVFGGMGSWNDMGFEGDEHDRYEKLSADLFALVNEAIASSVNSTAFD